jgi:hypothetical protein
MLTETRIGEYSVRRLCDENLPDVGRLYVAVYGKKPPANHFSEKYDTGYAGLKHVGFIAYNDANQAIAFYAVIPCFLVLHKMELLAAQSADTMTHPQYRNRGLFTELALLTYTLCETLGIQMLFGFPNQHSLHGFINKLGWKITETMDCFIIKTPPLFFNRLVRKLPLPGNAFAEFQISKLVFLNADAPHSVVAAGFAGVLRNEQYVNYKRYSRCRMIKIDDSIIWMKITDVLLIGDLEVKEKNFNNLMLRIIQLAERLGLREIHFHSSPGTNLYQLFASRYPFIKSFPVIIRTLGNNSPLAGVKFTSADFDTF